MKNNVLWYKRSARNFEKESLPLGNSIIGANIFGRINNDKITLNEETVWSGGPFSKDKNYTFGNVESIDGVKTKDTYKEVRELFKKGEDEQASALCEKLIGLESDYSVYQSFGELTIQNLTPHILNRKYKRSLDIENGVAYVEYISSHTLYTREYFCSHDKNLMCIKLSSQGSKSLSLAVSFKSKHDMKFANSLHNEYTFEGNVKNSNMKMIFALQHEHTSGYSQIINNKLVIKNADQIILYIVMKTNYANDYPNYVNKIDLNKYANDILKEASEEGYDKLKSKHVGLFNAKMNKMELNLKSKENNINTSSRLKDYKLGIEDVAFENLLFNYGRYLMISSSSSKSVFPTTLQGIWNESLNPPWGSDFHFNINLQMNYWANGPCGLSDSSEALINYYESLIPPARETYNIYTGANSSKDNPVGFMIHTQATAFGMVSPGWIFDWGWSPAAAAWMLDNIYDIYLYDGSQKLLNRIYPWLRELSTMYCNDLVYDKKNDRLLTSPCYSPEHGPRTQGNTYEQSIVFSLFKNTLDAMDRLDIENDELQKQIKEKIDKLKPFEISNTGLLKEWYLDGEIKSVQKNHRHVSHLLGLYPLRLINDDNDEIINAVIQSLNDRGDGGTGWAIAHKANLWARIPGQSKRTYSILKRLIKTSVLLNLWGTHPPFQIDANFGYSAAVIEMLIQTHSGYINPLASLPLEWQDGELLNVSTRFPVSLDIYWKDGLATHIKVSAKDDCEVKFKSHEKFRIKNITGHNLEKIPYNLSGDIVRFNLKKDEVVQINCYA